MCTIRRYTAIINLALLRRTAAAAAAAIGVRQHVVQWCSLHGGLSEDRDDMMLILCSLVLFNLCEIAESRVIGLPFIK